MIERLITIGLITSTEYIQQIKPVWNPKYLESESAQRIALWCMEYFDKYNKAPGKTIQDIYFEKLRDGKLPKELAEDVEDILQDLSDEYEESFNLQYAIDQTSKYFKERHLELHQEKIKDLMDAGEVDEAERLTSNYRGITFEISNELDLSNPSALLKVKSVFSELGEPVMRYPGVLGNLMNNQLIRGAFVAFMASEKRGKSYWLLDMAIRAAWKKAKVAFFQAGDMTELQQFRRICIYLTKKPIEEKYLGDNYIPVVDCVRNQLDLCTKSERESTFGPFRDEAWDEESIRKELSINDIIECYEDNKEYKPCRNCSDHEKKRLGIPWMEKKVVQSILTEREAEKKVEEFFIKKKRKLRISTHLNDSLTISEIRRILHRWESNENFIPDMIVIDYADLLLPSRQMEFRHSQNQIWKELRALSQERNCLLVTATQADAKSYEKDLLSLSNFSEDKRKYAHVTAMYGLNQDKTGREKNLGIMRINEMVVREGAFDTKSTVTVLQNLNLGRPFVGSYY